MTESVIVLLLVYIGVKEWFYHREIHKLLEKLMVKNLHEFEVSKKAGRIENKLTNQNVLMDEAEDPDYGVLSNIG